MSDERADTGGPADVAQGVEPAPMDAIAAALLEIFDTPGFRRQQIIRVGWGWLDKLQGTEPEPEEEPVFDASDIWSLSDWFDRCVEQLEAKDK